MTPEYSLQLLRSEFCSNPIPATRSVQYDAFLPRMNKTMQLVYHSDCTVNAVNGLIPLYRHLRHNKEFNAMRSTDGRVKALMPGG